MRRFIRYDHLGGIIGEVDENQIISMVRSEKINGEHALEIVTVQVLNKNERIIYQDGRSVWREYVVAGVDEEHATGVKPVGTYYCVWSMQVDLFGVPVSVMPGVVTPVTAGTALASALSTQSRWIRGAVTNTKTGGASMYDTTAWAAIGILIKNWGGELDATIGVDSAGVISRAVDLYTKQGDQTAKRRFDFGADLSSVKRIYADTPFYCRISPRGKGEETESGGYGRRVTIESVNAGKNYLEYAPMVDIAKVPDGNSGFIYPTLIAENGDCETPSELLVWAQSVLESYCTPKVTYEIDAIQAAIEGVDIQGVSLGDAVQVVDRKFGDGLRLTGRVIEMKVDELNERDITVKIGSAEESISAKFSRFDKIAEVVTSMNGGTLATVDYLNRLLTRINGEVNATGGYTYITEGQGIRTYDTAVSDPLVGSEAAAVVEVKGGTIRIANSRTAQGEWEWKTVFTSGHIAANLVTAANITAGYIHSPGGTFIDLDNDTAQLGATANAHTSIDSSGMEIINSDGLSIAYFGQSSNKPYARIGGVSDSSSHYLGNMVFEQVGTDGLSMSMKRGTSSLMSMNYDSTRYFSGIDRSKGPYFTVGTRNTNKGNPGYASCTIGDSCEAAYEYAFAGGSGSTANVPYSFVYGRSSVVNYQVYSSSDFGGAAIGDSLTVNGPYLACGQSNKTDSTARFIVGNGYAQSYIKSNAMVVDIDGNVDIEGVLTQGSDRRLKDHISYLDEDELAADFVRNLKPVLFSMKSTGAKHLGFYAQDVQEAEPDGWETDTVRVNPHIGKLDDMLALDYSALIAPIVAYAQSLEKRIEQLEQRLSALEGDA